MIRTPKRLWRSGLGLIAARASRKYIAGPRLYDAERLAAILSQRGYWITLGYWDADTDSLNDIVELGQSTVSALTRFSGNNYLSLKLPALRYDAGAFREISRAAQEHAIPLHFDSLTLEHAEPTFSFIREHLRSTPLSIGCTLPGRWRRSIDDVDLVRDLGLDVRVIKGQVADPKDPNREPRYGFMQIVERIAGDSPCVRVATHDFALARDALEHLCKAGTTCELELLYGLPIGNLVALASRMNVPVRMYIGFGHAYLPYAISGLKKHPRLLMSLVRQAFRSDYLATIPVCTSSRQTPVKN